jgi:hypothetical protein
LAAGTGLALSLEEEVLELLDGIVGRYCGAGVGGIDVGKDGEVVELDDIDIEGKFCVCDTTSAFGISPLTSDSLPSCPYHHYLPNLRPKDRQLLEAGAVQEDSSIHSHHL